MRDRQVPVRMTYSSSAKAGYIYLREIEEGGVAHSIRVEQEDLRGMRGDLILDFDKQWRLVGIEVLGASKVLPKELLDKIV